MKVNLRVHGRRTHLVVQVVAAEPHLRNVGINSKGVVDEHLVLVERVNRHQVTTLGATHALGVDPVLAVLVDGPSAVDVYKNQKQ